MNCFVLLLSFYFSSVLADPELMQNYAQSINELIRLRKVPFPPPPFPFPPPNFVNNHPMKIDEDHGSEHIQHATMPNEAKENITRPDVVVFPENVQEDIKVTAVTPTLRPAQRACETYLKLPINRVLGGSPAESGEFPWMAALGYLKETYEVSFECGGTIISDLFILTAAHCVPSSRPPVVIRLGKVTLTDVDGIRPDNHPIQDYIRHPNYSLKTKKNDIALIRIAKRIYFTNDIAPACMQMNLYDLNADLIVTGWGKTTVERGDRSDILLKAQLRTLPLPECNQIFSKWNAEANQAAFRDGLIGGQYCAYDPQGKNDSCQGDSGGPLQYFPNGNSAISTVLGIVSFGFSCGTELPGIYTRVAYYLDWIESIVWPNP